MLKLQTIHKWTEIVQNLYELYHSKGRKKRTEDCSSVHDHLVYFFLSISSTEPDTSFVSAKSAKAFGSTIR